MANFPPKNDDISIVLSGAAGQGVQTVEQMLTRLFKSAGYNLFSTKEYMSRVRGGSNSTEIRVSSNPVDALLDRIDILFPLNCDALKHVEQRIGKDTIIIGEKEKFIQDCGRPGTNIIDVPLTELAQEVGGAIYTNIIASGLIAALFGIDRKRVDEYLDERFSAKGDVIVAKNVDAAGKGYEIGKALIAEGIVTIQIAKDPSAIEKIIINGGDAIAMGAIAGGCDFISSYPMTPSTSVLTYLAKHAEQCGIIAEQAEDEIAAINMSIGAWYAGARAMVSTSGGGFALMNEGVSLAGIIESPMVIHLAQRPGPATGLPTRTEQGDLDLVLYAGHGEFPRVIFAPGTLEDAFYLSANAFNLAAEFQVPVFVLSDQYFVDSYYNIPRLDLDGMTIENHVVETDRDYKRYAITDSGVSPRGIPGGEGLVVVDSDEHDEDGHLTERHDIRIEMVGKRMRKHDLLVDRAFKPELIGPEDAETVFICWGSTYTMAREAYNLLGRDDIALLYFKQLFPLHSSTGEILSRAKRIVSIEGNVSAQFTRLLKIHADIVADKVINKYNGLAFSVEELRAKMNKALI